MDMYDGILTTRAMRRFTDEPVTDEQVMACIRAAVQGPSGGNLQPWQYLVVTEPATKAALGDLYRRAYDRYEAALLPLIPPSNGRRTSRAGGAPSRRPATWPSTWPTRRCWSWCSCPRSR